MVIHDIRQMLSDIVVPVSKASISGGRFAVPLAPGSLVFGVPYEIKILAGTLREAIKLRER